MSQKIITFMLGVACIALLIAGGILYLFSDRTPPEIRLNDEITYFQEGMDTETLLEGVTAYDEVDGDVSDSLRVEIVPFGDGTSAKVTYIAIDGSNNVARASITVTYKGAGEKGESSSKEESEEASAETADDDTKDKDDKEENASEDDNSESDGAQDVENDDKSELTSTGSPVVRLKNTQVVLPVGSAFNVANYVDEIVDDKDDSFDLFRKIQVGGDYAAGITNTAGTYDIKVYVVDSDGNQSNVESLTLVVE